MVMKMLEYTTLMEFLPMVFALALLVAAVKMLVGK